MTEPAMQNGLWSFWLTADDSVLQFVNNLNCILPVAQSPFFRRTSGRVMVSINPRYDHQEAWTWIYSLLEAETQIIDLGETWEEAIELACQSEDEY
jgi:hypothetical protein